MDPISTAKLIVELGVLTVIAGVFIVLSYTIIKRMMDKFFESLPKSESSPDPVHPTDEQVDELDVISRSLYEESRGILTNLHADRAYIVLFHNGGKSSSGLFFQKMSCICEVVSPGIQALSSTFQNIHRTSYSYLLGKLRDQGEWLVDDINEYKEEAPFLYGQAVDRHVVSTYMVLLTDAKNAAIGFMGIDYCSPKSGITTKEISKSLNLVGNRVASLVDIKDKVKGKDE